MQPSRTAPPPVRTQEPQRPAPLPHRGTVDAASRLPAATTTVARAMKRHAPSGTPARRQRVATLAALAIATAMLTTFAVALLTSKGHADGFASRLLLRREDDSLDARRRLTVFGADDRRAVSDASLYPYSAVGLLKWSADRNCTASLVGSKYALTAADCVLSRDGAWRASSLAQPELLVGGGAAATSAHVVKVHRQSEYWTEWTQDTYVLLELDAPLGDTLGKLLLPTAEDLNQSQGKTPVQLVGFDDDVTRTTAASPKPALKFAKCTCYFPGTFSGPQYMLHHDCDTSAIGSPGSVLLVRYTSMETYIIGIHTNLIGEDAPEVEEDAALAGYSDAVANRGVLGPFVQQHLKALLANATETSVKDGSSSGSNAGLPPVGSTPSSATPRPSTPRDSGQNEGAVGNTADPDARISAETAYVCISFVGAAWACILFIVLRHIRNRK